MASTMRDTTTRALAEQLVAKVQAVGVATAEAIGAADDLAGRLREPRPGDVLRLHFPALVEAEGVLEDLEEGADIEMVDRDARALRDLVRLATDG